MSILQGVEEVKQYMDQMKLDILEALNDNPFESYERFSFFMKVDYNNKYPDGDLKLGLQQLDWSGLASYENIEMCSVSNGHEKNLHITEKGKKYLDNIRTQIHPHSSEQPPQHPQTVPGSQ